jgi:RNA-binding protein
VLTSAGKKQLKARAHALKPVVLVGQHGVTAAVMASVDEALVAHELIKIRLPAGDRTERNLLAVQIAAGLDADVVSTIGRVVILYRRRAEPD